MSLILQITNICTIPIPIIQTLLYPNSPIIRTHPKYGFFRIIGWYYMFINVYVKTSIHQKVVFIKKERAIPYRGNIRRRKFSSGKIFVGENFSRGKFSSPSQHFLPFPRRKYFGNRNLYLYIFTFRWESHSSGKARPTRIHSSSLWGKIIRRGKHGLLEYILVVCGESHSSRKARPTRIHSSSLWGKSFVGESTAY